MKISVRKMKITYQSGNKNICSLYTFLLISKHVKEIRRLQLKRFEIKRIFFCQCNAFIGGISSNLFIICFRSWRKSQSALQHTIQKFTKLNNARQNAKQSGNAQPIQRTMYERSSKNSQQTDEILKPNQCGINKHVLGTFNIFSLSKWSL